MQRARQLRPQQVWQPVRQVHARRVCERPNTRLHPVTTVAWQASTMQGWTQHC